MLSKLSNKKMITQEQTTNKNRSKMKKMDPWFIDSKLNVLLMLRLLPKSRRRKLRKIDLKHLKKRSKRKRSRKKKKQKRKRSRKRNKKQNLLKKNQLERRKRRNDQFKLDL